MRGRGRPARRTARRARPPRRPPGRRGAGPHVRRDDQDGEIGGSERHDRGLGRVARHVADHRLARPAAGPEHRDHRGRRGPVRGPVAREHGQPARPSTSGAGSAACRAPAGTRPAPVPPRASADRRGPPRRGRGPRRRPADRSRRAAPILLAPPVRPSRPPPTSTDAPAPPLPPTTASTRAVAASPPSATSASAATSQGSASGRETTCSAPTATACLHASGGGSPETATTTPDARGSRRPRSSVRRAAVEQDDRRASASSGEPRWGRGPARPRTRRPRPSAAPRRADRCRTPSPARAGPRPAPRPAPSPVSCSSPSSAHLRPPRRGPVRAALASLGSRTPSGPTVSAVDGGSRLWTTGRFGGRRRVVGAVGTMKAPACVCRARSATVWRETATPNRYRLRRP